MAPRPTTPGWFERAFLRALAIGLVVSVAVFVVYLLWIIGAIVDANALGAAAIFAIAVLVLVFAMVLVAATLGALQRADADLNPSA